LTLTALANSAVAEKPRDAKATLSLAYAFVLHLEMHDKMF